MSELVKDEASSLEFITAGETESPRKVLVLLHGSGTDYADMLGLSGEMKDSLPPGTLLLIPNGPHLMIDLFPKEEVEAAKKADPDFDWSKARNWFGAAQVEGLSEEGKIAAVREPMADTAKSLNTLIDGQLKKFGLEEKDLVIYGFSAGGVAALNTGLLRHETPCAGVISHSGYFYGVKRVLSKPDVLLVVGDQELVEGHPMQNMHTMTKEFLGIYKVKTQEHVCKNLAHGFNKEAFDVVIKAIRTAFGKGDIDLSIEFEEEEPQPIPLAKPTNAKRFKL